MYNGKGLNTVYQKSFVLLLARRVTTIRHLAIETDYLQSTRSSDIDIIRIARVLNMFVVGKREYTMSPRLLGSRQVS